MTKTKSELAVVHVLQKIKENPRVAYHFCPATESYRILTESYAESEGIDVDGFRADFIKQLTFKE